MMLNRKDARIGTERSVKEAIRSLPDKPGVYLFYGKEREPLYIGKSRKIRTRVRSHFRAPEETRMCRRVRHIEARRTVGELGALLLESLLIKEIRPFYNKLSRHRRRIIIARRFVNTDGYIGIDLEATVKIDPTRASDILGIFKTKTQAKEFLSLAAKTHRLCLNLIGLERSKRSCFSYHLHQCNGACIGLEEPGLYNARVNQAFDERRIKAWPFTGAIIIEEKDDEGAGEVFIVDNWCLLYSFTYSNNKPSLRVRGIHQFDYDSYRIIAGYVFRKENKEHIRPARKNEIGTLLRKAQAA